MVGTASSVGASVWNPSSVLHCPSDCLSAYRLGKLHFRHAHHEPAALTYLLALNSPLFETSARLPAVCRISNQISDGNGCLQFDVKGMSGKFPF